MYRSSSFAASLSSGTARGRLPLPSDVGDREVVVDILDRQPGNLGEPDAGVDEEHHDRRISSLIESQGRRTRPGGASAGPASERQAASRGSSGGCIRAIGLAGISPS